MVAVALAVMTSVIVIIALKYPHDYVREGNEKHVDRYIETTGRVTALVVGAFAIEMIMRDLKGWLAVV